MAAAARRAATVRRRQVVRLGGAGAAAAHTHGKSVNLGQFFGRMRLRVLSTVLQVEGEREQIGPLPRHHKLFGRIHSEIVLFEAEDPQPAWQSVAISGNPWQSVAISSNHRASEVGSRQRILNP